MGGYGSGQWYRYGAKRRTALFESLDINRLNRGGCLESGCLSYVSWRRGEDRVRSIAIRAEEGRLVLDYGSRVRESEWEHIIQPVPLTWTPCHYGGQRPWFLCPGVYCGRRAAKLYGAGKYFLCRHCYNLAYASQAVSSRDRPLRIAQSIRIRLGGSGSIGEPFPLKPKGTHWVTYQQLRQKAERGERRYLRSLDERLLAWCPHW